MAVHKTKGPENNDVIISFNPNESFHAKVVKKLVDKILLADISEALKFHQLKQKLKRN